jgi:acetyltransferase-like isoleucine patch superfamily enzyme
VRRSAKTGVKSSLYNPLVEYTHWLLNRARARVRHPTLEQQYLAFASHCEFEPHVSLHRGAVVGWSRIGSHSYVGAGTTMVNTTVGRYCSIGPGCRLGGGRHPSKTFVSTSPMFYSTRGSDLSFADKDYFDEYADITVGHDVWIGAGAIVVDGARIGDGAIVAAGAVVSGEVAPYAVVGGVPAKVIRRRFEDEQVRFLLEFRWWDRDEAWLRDNFRQFHDIDAFIAAFGPLPGAA